MTAAQDQFAVLARQGQEALTNAVRAWAETVQRLSASPGLTMPEFNMPDLGALGTGASGPGASGLSLPGLSVSDLMAAVDQAFDVAEQVLTAQREMTKAVLRVLTGSLEGPGGAG